jgi:hypothetical protein
LAEGTASPDRCAKSTHDEERTMTASVDDPVASASEQFALSRSRFGLIVSPEGQSIWLDRRDAHSSREGVHKDP